MNTVIEPTANRAVFAQWLATGPSLESLIEVEEQEWSRRSPRKDRLARIIARISSITRRAKLRGAARALAFEK